MRTALISTQQIPGAINPNDDHPALMVEVVHDALEAVVFLTEQVLNRHLDVFIEHV